MTYSHEELITQDQKQLHPLHHPNTHRDPLMVERAEGVWLYTTDGRRILDGMAGLWNVNIGYGNKELPQVAKEQMEKVAYTSNFAGMTTPPASQLAAKLAGYAHPNLNMTFFTSGGSESNDTAFKTVRYYWRRMGRPTKTKIISRTQAYHGITLAATFATGIERYWRMFGPPMPDFVHIPAPNSYRFTGNVAEGESVAQSAARALEEMILREGPENVGAFIAEPIQGAGGLVVPPAEYFPLVREICTRYEVLLIVDEVITGFGRTGEMFALPRYGVQPDIMSFAKGITSGYLPLGGIQISDEIREAIMSAPPEEMWMHGYTYSGHAASCAVALANIEIIERDGLVENSRQMGARLLAGLEALAEEFPKVANARGVGLLCGIEMVQDKQSRLADDAAAVQVANRALAKGMRTRPLGNTLAFSPSLIISAEEVDQIVTTLGEVFAEMH